MKKLVVSVVSAILAGCANQSKNLNVDHLIRPEPRWTLLEATSTLDTLVFVDETSIQRDGQFAYIWGAIATTKPEKKADTTTGLLKLNCQSRQVTEVANREYRQGVKINEKINDSDAWHHVQRGSLKDKYYRIACFDERFNHRGVVIEGSIQAYWRDIKEGLKAALDEIKSQSH